MGKVFKTALFGGFKKKEVIAYLDGLSREKKLDKERHDEQAVKLEQSLCELKNELEGAEAAAAGLEAELERLKHEREPLRQKLAGLEAENASLSGELSRQRSRCLELEQHNSSLSSSVLDFDDERRSMQADMDELKKDFDERRRELEARIFDLEAEIVEGMDHRAPTQDSAERAYRGAREVSRSIADVGQESGKRVLEDLRAQLEDIIEEINRLIRAQEPDRPAPPTPMFHTPAMPAGKREKRPEPRLNSLGEILKYVKYGKPQ